MGERSHRRAWGAALCAALLAATPAGAGTDLAGGKLSGEVEAGYQKIAGDTDAAKFDEYRDERQWILGGKFLFEAGDGRHYLRGWFDDLLQKDGRYRLEGGQWGVWGLFGEYSELPHNISYDSRTPYLGNADLALPFSRPSPDLAADVDAALGGKDLGFRTLTARAGGFYRPTRRLELRTSYRLLDKKGSLFRGGLNSFFISFADFATPIDEEIHEFSADASWLGEGWSASFNYTGNLYDNEAGEALRLDSPVSGVDAIGSPSRWQMALAPDNQAHSFRLAGAFLLPTSFSTRLTASLGYGLHLQDESFLPATLNTAFAADPRLIPSRGDLGGEVSTLLADLRLSSRPLEALDLKAHYRFYDYSNDSHRVRLDAEASSDTTLRDLVPGETDRRSVANEYTRQNAGLEAAWALSRNGSLGFGWEWEQWRRDSSRQVRRTDEQGPHARLDWKLGSRTQLRADYAFSTRRRSGYRPFAYLDEALDPAIAGTDPEDRIFPELRRFDQADRRRHEAHLSARFLPRPELELALSGGVDVSDYHRSDYGLRDDEYWNLGADLVYEPFDWLRLSAYYSFDRGYSRLDSRQRNPGVEDPSLDWSTRTDDEAHNAGLQGWVDLLPGRLEGELSYAFQRGRVRTHSGGPNPTAVDWPDQKNSLHQLAGSLRLRVNEQLSLKTEYRWEFYRQRDFQRDELPAVVGNDILLASDVGDYRAHVYAVSLVYGF